MPSKKSGLLLFTLFLGLFTSHLFAASAYLTNVRLSHQGDKTRIVLDLTKKVTYSIAVVDKDQHLVIDINLKDTKNQARFNQLDFQQALIKNIRIGRQTASQLRIVLDLKQAVQHKAFWLTPAGQYKYHRLVIDLTSTGKPLSAKTSSKTTTAKKLRNLVVIIDAGHGGKDPGAVSRHGYREKRVVLSIARYSRTDLNKIPGITAKLTRSDDRFLSLRQRLGKARTEKADMFLSIHADAAPSRSASGASVYALSQRGASSESARWLADRENKALALGGDITLYDKNPLLSSVLLDMSQTATINASLELGQFLLQSIGNISKLHSKRVGQAAFVVLKSPDIPSVLIETGFISNAKEARLLASKSYQQKMAQAITRGIVAYFRAKMPRDTRFTTHIGARNYKVKKGDSLSKIVAQHGVTVNALKQANRLKSNTIRVGQVLKIPAIAD